MPGSRGSAVVSRTQPAVSAPWLCCLLCWLQSWTASPLVAVRRWPASRSVLCHPFSAAPTEGELLSPRCSYRKFPFESEELSTCCGWLGIIGLSQEAEEWVSLCEPQQLKVIPITNLSYPGVLSSRDCLTSGQRSLVG